MEKLFTPIKLGDVEIKNRVVLPSMCVHFCNKDGHINDCFREYVRRRAAGGGGLLVIPGSPHGKVSAGRPALSDDSYLPDWEELAKIVHQYGAKLFCQIHPAKHQAGRGEKVETPADFTLEELDGLVESYSDCAVRCKKAGVDGVDIHGAHAHEIALFLSGLYNNRTDEYGGSVEGRALFPSRIIKAIKQKCGPGFPVIFRISGIEMVDGGRQIEDTGLLSQCLEAAGTDAIHVSIGMPESGGYISAPMDVEDCFNANNAAIVKSYVKIPVITANRIVDIAEAAAIVESGKADMVSMARAQLADPELVNKYLGKNKEPVYRCIGCNQGCRDSAVRKKIICMQNPLLGREEAISFVPATAEEKKKKIMIAGAGPAGLEFACNLVRRGLKPEIYEAEGTPGGLVNLAAVAPHKQNLLSLITSRTEFLMQNGVEIHCNTRVTPELVEKINPDVLAVCTGSKPLVPPIPGADKDFVVTGDEVLQQGKPSGKHIMVLGAGLIGCEVADFLAEGGNRLTVVDVAEKPAGTLNSYRRNFMLKRMERYSIEWIMGSKITRIEAGKVTVEREGREQTVPKVDFVVIAAGRSPVADLADGAKKPGRKVIVLGDAAAAATALEAVYDSVEPALHVFD